MRRVARGLNRVDAAQQRIASCRPSSRCVHGPARRPVPQGLEQGREDLRRRPRPRPAGPPSGNGRHPRGAAARLTAQPGPGVVQRPRPAQRSRGSRGPRSGERRADPSPPACRRAGRRAPPAGVCRRDRPRISPSGDRKSLASSSAERTAVAAPSPPGSRAPRAGPPPSRPHVDLAALRRAAGRRAAARWRSCGSVPAAWYAGKPARPEVSTSQRRCDSPRRSSSGRTAPGRRRAARGKKA